MGRRPSERQEIWYKMWATYPTHDKTDKLKRVLGSEEADCYPMRLWCYTRLTHPLYGTFEDAKEVEDSCRWLGEKGKLYKALVDCEFFEKDGLTVRKWYEYFASSYEKKKEHKRDVYARKVGLPDSEPVEADVQPHDAVEHYFRLARAAKLPDHPAAIRSHIDAWIARSNAQAVEQILMDPWSRGKSCREIQQHFFNTNGSKSIQDISEEWVRESMEQEKAKSQ